MHEEWDSLDLSFARVLTAEASTSTRCVTVQVAASGDEGDTNEDTERGDAVEVLQPLGLLAVPTVTSTTQAPFMRVGDQMVALGIIDKGAAAQSVEAQETRLYGAGSGNATANVRIRASGAVEVNSKTNTNITLTAGGTGVVTMQDGSQAFLRGNQFATAVTTFITADNTMLTALTVVMTAIGVFATAVGVAVPAVAGAAVVLNTAIGVFNGAVATRQTAGSAFDSATTASLSTKVLGQ